MVSSYCFTLNFTLNSKKIIFQINNLKYKTITGYNQKVMIITNTVAEH